MNKPIQLLLVEDSEDDARLAVRVLRQAGFAPTWRRVQDAPALKAAIREEPWDAVLSDFRLPSFSGVEALQIFRDSGLDIPFIFVSGTIGEETAVEAMKAGASDYVMKQNLARLAPALERELGQAVIRAQHRQAQIDLEVSRDRYVDLYDFAPVGYLSVSAQGSISQINLTGADLLGDTRERLLADRFSRFVTAEDADRWARHFLDLLHGADARRVELALQRADGSHFHAHLDCMCATADGDSPVRIAITDISDRKEAEADMRKFETQLRQVQKMESVGTLAGGIAHDFNNILGGILGNVAFAKEQVGTGHAALPYLDEIHKASSRARTLVRQILTFSRREPQELLTQALRPIVEETCKLLRATLPTRVELTLTTADDAPSVHADATQIQQVLMNLGTNAWHALKDGAGHIRIGLGCVVVGAAQPTRVPALDLPAGRFAHLWVSDDGTGMDAVTRERIFEPFFTTKPVGQGTGLGLSVVHGIVTAHHGAIHVESDQHRGSTFHLYLPAVEVEQAESETQASATEHRHGHGEHVLYVDDDETMVVMVESLLQRAGYRVSSFGDALQAITAVRDAPQSFDCVVTDFNMPDFSGLDVAREVSSIRPELPVVISSGYITEELRRLAREAGVLGLLEKQNTFEELADLLGSTLAAARRSTAGRDGSH